MPQLPAFQVGVKHRRPTLRPVLTAIRKCGKMFRSRVEKGYGTEWLECHLGSTRVFGDVWLSKTPSTGAGVLVKTRKPVPWVDAAAPIESNLLPGHQVRARTSRIRGHGPKQSAGVVHVRCISLER